MANLTLPWNWVRARVVLDDWLLVAELGAGGMTREEARARGRVVRDEDPELGEWARMRRLHPWQHGLFDSLSVMAVYEYPAEVSADAAGRAWLQGFAGELGRSGMRLQIAATSAACRLSRAGTVASRFGFLRNRIVCSRLRLVRQSRPGKGGQQGGQ